jgi:hypothetical protein
VGSPEFSPFLDKVEKILALKPTDSVDGVDLDWKSVEVDNLEFCQYSTSLTVRDRLLLMVSSRQKLITTGLTMDNLRGFEEYPKYEQLATIARDGLQPFMTASFTPNRGRGDFRRESLRQRLIHTISGHIRKAQDKKQCIILPLSYIQDVEGVHLSAIHVAYTRRQIPRAVRVAITNILD